MTVTVLFSFLLPINPSHLQYCLGHTITRPVSGRILMSTSPIIDLFFNGTFYSPIPSVPDLHIGLVSVFITHRRSSRFQVYFLVASFRIERIDTRAPLVTGLDYKLGRKPYERVHDSTFQVKSTKLSVTYSQRKDFFLQPRNCSVSYYE